MAPKKAAAAVADSPPTEALQVEEKDEKKTASTLRKLTTHPSTVIMTREAIKALDSRKGVSSQAIQRYIKQKYPSVDSVRLKGLVNKALKKGIETGTLVRPANATATTGATGKFRLPPKSKGPQEKSKEAKAENVDPNVQDAPKAEKESKGETKKKKPAAKKEPKEDDKSSEEPKPAKKSKKNEDVLIPKVAPPKKPKAAKKAETEEAEECEPMKPKGKPKAVKEDKVKPEKEDKVKPEKGKAAQSKAAKSEAPTKAQGKRGKASE